MARQQLFLLGAFLFSRLTFCLGTLPPRFPVSPVPHGSLMLNIRPTGLVFYAAGRSKSAS
jgi:hypothetical protein